jgi:penicillin-binding protein 1C
LQAAGTPRITAPPSGALMAWDPDIPPGVQGIVARHSGDAAGLQWRLNGEPLADTGPRVVLPLVAGPNVLTLADADGQAIDEVRFSVRGMPRR